MHERKCPYCKGTGINKTADGTPFQCPDCDGTGTLYEPETEDIYDDDE